MTAALDQGHLRMTVADEQGRVTVEHVGYGCIVRTTAKIPVALLPDHQFCPAPDAESGCDELVIRTGD